MAVGWRKTMPTATGGQAGRQARHAKPAAAGKPETNKTRNAQTQKAKQK
jgi:hypothetical protein